jgi:hypothetical protein
LVDQGEVGGKYHHEVYNVNFALAEFVVVVAAILRYNIISLRVRSVPINVALRDICSGYTYTLSHPNTPHHGTY